MEVVLDGNDSAQWIPYACRYAAFVRHRTVLCTTIHRLSGLYSRLEATMADKYRMTPQGSEFIVNENAGGTVGIYKTKQEAQRGMEDCQRDDFMLHSARSLVNAAVQACMQMHDIDRQAAHGWIREAAG